MDPEIKLIIILIIPFFPFTHIFNTYYRQEVYTNPFILVQLWNN